MDYFENLYHNDTTGASVGELNLYCCGKRNNAPNHRFGPAARDNFWLIYMREGCGTFTMSQKSYRVGKNMLFVAYPNRRLYYRADADSVWSINWCSIGGERLEEYFGLMHITEDDPVITIDAASAVENLFNSLFDAIPLDTVQSKFTCMSLVYKLLSLMTESTLRAGSERDYIDEAIFFMSNNYDRSITIADVADGVNLNHEYFSRLFKAKTKLSPSQWLLRFRLDKAVSLMRTTDLKISEIARSVGFEDPMYFARVFKRICGAAPSVYRKKYCRM